MTTVIWIRQAGGRYGACVCPWCDAPNAHWKFTGGSGWCDACSATFYACDDPEDEKVNDIQRVGTSRMTVYVEPPDHDY